VSDRGAVATPGSAGVATTTAEAVPVPTELIAETLNEYDMPLVSEEIVADVAVVPMDCHVVPLVEYSTKYEVIAAPPFETGAFHVSDTDALPDTAVAIVGALGVVAGAGANEPE